MKYFITAFVTAVVVFLGATVYYKGLPNFTSPSGVSVTSTEVAATPTTNPTPTPSGDNTDLISAMRAALIIEHGQDTGLLNVTVSKIEGDYAQGGASGQGGGGMWFAAKVSGVWKLVWDGNGIIDCNNVAPYPNFPRDMIPDCFATSSGKLITR